MSEREDLNLRPL